MEITSSSMITLSLLASKFYLEISRFADLGLRFMHERVIPYVVNSGSALFSHGIKMSAPIGLWYHRFLRQYWLTIRVFVKLSPPSLDTKLNRCAILVIEGASS